MKGRLSSHNHFSLGLHNIRRQLFGIRVNPQELRKVNEYRHLKYTNLFEVSFTLSFGHRLSVELGLIRSCPPHEDRFWWWTVFEAARKQNVVF